MLPLLVIREQPSGLGKGGPDLAVKLMESRGMQVWGCQAHAVHEFAGAGTLLHETEADLRVLALDKLVEQFGSSGDFVASVFIAEGYITYGSAQKLKVAVSKDSRLSSFPVDEQVFGEQGGKVNTRARSWEHEFALLDFELEPKLKAFIL